MYPIATRIRKKQVVTLDVYAAFRIRPQHGGKTTIGVSCIALTLHFPNSRMGDLVHLPDFNHYCD